MLTPPYKQKCWTLDNSLLWDPDRSGAWRIRNFATWGTTLNYFVLGCRQAAWDSELCPLRQRGCCQEDRTEAGISRPGYVYRSFVKSTGIWCSVNTNYLSPVLWIRIRIRIGSGFNGVPGSVSAFAIRIRIEKRLIFEVLDVLFWGLKASPELGCPIWRPRDK